MNHLANVLLLIATLLTIWLGISFVLPLPLGPDRAMVGLGGVFIQTPRWICLAVVLGLCVARGAFTWPADRAAQYLIVFVAHALIGLGCLAAGMGALGSTGGVSPRMARVLALGTLVVPVIQIIFAAWYLNPTLRGTLDATTVRGVTNGTLAVFALAVLMFGAVGALAYQSMRRHYAHNRAEGEAREHAKQAAIIEAEDHQFRALMPESPLIDWIQFLQSTTSEELHRAAHEAILKRPALVPELRAIIGSTNTAQANKAMRFVSETPRPPAEVSSTVRERARFVVSVAESIDPNGADTAEILHQQAGDLADGIRRAAWGLFRVGEDLRPELRAIADACGPRERNSSRDIAFECNAMIRFIDDLERQAAAAR